MDSQWFNQVTRGYDHHHQSNTENNVDLTLKLGLPIDHDHDQPKFEPYFRSTTVLIKTHQPANFLNFSAPFTQGTNHYEMANGAESTGLNHHGVLSQGGEAGMNPYGMPNGGNLHGSWSQEMGNHPIYTNNGTDAQNATGSVMGFPAYPNTYISFNSNPGNGPTTLLNMLPRNVDHGDNGSSSGSHRRSSRRQCEDSHIDSNKRCSNRSCKTKDTPMWRKGPLGPKTLCNACGIKYRKEEEKRRAREAAKKNSENKDG